ncbi:MAG: hypothetical protein H0T40_00235 [Geodermatophilaceae bacterium]|nr:hypothetical protein [Geodermatophilaceae bacterium]
MATSIGPAGGGGGSGDGADEEFAAGSEPALSSVGGEADGAAAVRPSGAASLTVDEM